MYYLIVNTSLRENTLHFLKVIKFLYSMSEAAASTFHENKRQDLLLGHILSKEIACSLRHYSKTTFP